MDVSDVESLVNTVCADLRAQVEFLKTQVADVCAQRDAAHESERRLWRAFAMVKGAAEYARGVMDGWQTPDTTITNDDLVDAVERVVDDIACAERLSGCAVET